MWTRAELKAKAKTAFKANYWRCVFVSFVIALLTGVGASAGSTGTAAGGAAGQGFNNSLNDVKSAFAGNSNVAMAVLLIILGVVMIAVTASVLIDIFAKNIFLVGTSAFYAKNTEEPATVESILVGFKNGAYFRNAGAMFLRNLFIALATLFFIVPGIIVGFMLKMVPYILAENPEMRAMDAIRESARIMKGNKWKAFVLDLSFIGWDILAGLTLGILGIFYVAPYKDATEAELYKAIK